MNGSDFLNKLENLDPGLVAAAAEPPEPKVRRGPDWGALGAAAACLAAIAVPLALTYLINGVAPAIEPRGGSGAGSASHQASVLADEAAPPDEGAGAGSPGLVEVSEFTLEGYSYTQYKLTEEYCGAFPEGLPAEEYFKYNVQGLGAVPELWGGLSYETEPLDGSSVKTREWAWEFSGLLSGDYTEPVISADLSGDLKRISIQAEYGISWRDDGSDSRLTVDICEGAPVDSAFLAGLKAISNETVAVFPEDSSGGRKMVFALGGLDSDRCLYTWLPYTGIWCRIVGGASIPVEDMAAILNWLFSAPEMLGEINPLADYNPEVHPYIPTPLTNDCAASIGGTGCALEGRSGKNPSEQNVLALEVSYLEGYDDRPLESYRIDRLESYEGQDESMGGLYDLTRDMVDSQYNFQKRFMATSRSSDRNMERQPVHYVFNFTWDDYYVTATFNETLTADQLWSFFQQLAGKEQPEASSAEAQAEPDSSLRVYIETCYPPSLQEG